MECKEIKVSYNPKGIANYLKEKGKHSFTVFDLVDQCGGDQSIAFEILHRLTTFKLLVSQHNVEYFNNIPYLSFHFVNSDSENLEKLTESLPEKVEVTFKRWI